LNEDLGDINDKLKEINGKVLKHLVEIEEAIEAIKSANPNAETTDISSLKFEISKRTL